MRPICTSMPTCTTIPPGDIALPVWVQLGASVQSYNHAKLCGRLVVVSSWVKSDCVVVSLVDVDEVERAGFGSGQVLMCGKVREDMIRRRPHRCPQPLE